MGSLTDTLENEVLDHILKVGSYSPPATCYLALYTADPGEAGVHTNEADYTSYARVSITFSAAASRKVESSGDVTFPKATGGSNTITHWGVVDGDVEGSGTMMAYGAFATSKAISDGYTPVVEDATVDIEFSSGGVATAYANSILDWLFRAQTLNQPTDIYVALHSTACSDSAAGTELSGSAYARKVCNTWNTASGGASANTGAITYEPATGDWSTAVYASLYDAVTGGTYMLYLDVNDLQVLNGDTGRFPAGDLDVTLG